jgi:hypothetical protein
VTHTPPPFLRPVSTGRALPSRSIRGTTYGPSDNFACRMCWRLLGLDKSIGILVDGAAVEGQGLPQGLEGDS